MSTYLTPQRCGYQSHPFSHYLRSVTMSLPTVVTVSVLVSATNSSAQGLLPTLPLLFNYFLGRENLIFPYITSKKSTTACSAKPSAYCLPGPGPGAIALEKAFRTNAGQSVHMEPNQGGANGTASGKQNKLRGSRKFILTFGNALKSEGDGLQQSSGWEYSLVQRSCAWGWWQGKERHRLNSVMVTAVHGNSALFLFLFVWFTREGVKGIEGRRKRSRKDRKKQTFILKGHLSAGSSPLNKGTWCEFCSISENIPTSCKCSFPFTFFFFHFKISVILKSHFSYPFHRRGRHSKWKLMTCPGEAAEIFFKGQCYSTVPWLPAATRSLHAPAPASPGVHPLWVLNKLSHFVQ